MGITNEYFSHQLNYEKKYGDKTVVVMQVGSFYEIYEYQPINAKKIGYAYEVSQLLNMKFTSKNNKEAHSIENPKLVGFPVISYENHKDILLNNGYTVVLITQDETKSGNAIKRSVKEILSPSTQIDTKPINNTLNNNIVSIYIEIMNINKVKKYEYYELIIGLATIDISTGKNNVIEFYSKPDDPMFALQETYRYLLTHRPRELIINLKDAYEDGETSNKYIEYLTKQLELDKYQMVIIKTGEVNKEYYKEAYQKHFLEKIFKKETNDIIDDLELDRCHYGCISYLILLQYCYEHNELIIQKIDKPDTKWSDNNKHLTLTYNAIKQLDLETFASSNKVKYDSLFSIINSTSTPLGKRLLQHNLLNPLTNIEQIEFYYNLTDELLQSIPNTEIKLVDRVDRILKSVPDFEKLHRKLCLELIKPNEFSLLFNGYLKFIELINVIVNDNINNTYLKQLFLSSQETLEFNNMLNFILSRIDLDKLEKTIEQSYLIKNTDPEIDNLSSIIDSNESHLRKICGHLNSFINSTRGKPIEPSIDNESIKLIVSTSKSTYIKNSNFDKSLCGELMFIPVTSAKSEVIITSTIIDDLIKTIINAKTKLIDSLSKYYHNTIKYLLQFKFYQSINRFISIIDYVKSNAINTLKYRYYRPIIDKSYESSFIDFKDVRHPIIERLSDNLYITNDVSLGLPNSNLGLILFGVNGLGKTSLIKAIGLNVILAQIGYFTAGRLTYRPFKNIITRLSGHDDIFKGHSSFVVEMLELKTILKNSNHETLVLSDELSRGSEIVSGTSLCIATFLTLIQRKTCFISASHIHQLPNHPKIKSLLDQKLLSLNHFSATYDPIQDILIYDRKLKSGSGSTLYGLEVAKSLKLDPHFLQLSSDIRKSILDQSSDFLSTHKSRYNSNVYVDSCSICNKKSSLHTHHIHEQNLADSSGFIDHFHKNSSFNLLVLCESCHQSLHKNHQQIKIQQTSSGPHYLLVDPK